MRQLLAIAILVGFYPHSASACPAIVPVPATQPDVQCYTIDKPLNVRCASPISSNVCTFLNNTALAEGLLTQGAFDYLGQIGFCAMVNNLGDGDQIFDFCPRGCFAADTLVLTDVALDGKASYAQAASVRPQSSLMSLTDDASLGDVSLAPQSVKRVVVGPETNDLFVFGLANGSSLRVTEHHPMVLDTGKIVEANQVDSKMSFVGLDGQSVAVTSITREKAVKDVFNFETAGTTLLSHIIVADGVLVGDLKLQNALANEEGAIALRR